MNEITTAATTIALGIIGVAVLAVLVSSRSQTPAVFQSLGSAFSNALGVAISPVTGTTVQPNVSYPTGPYAAFGSSPLSFGFPSMQ